jgi:uncharacterized membrane protein
MKKAVFCLANNKDHADHIIDKLISAQFNRNDISILASDSPTFHNIQGGAPSPDMRNEASNKGAGNKFANMNVEDNTKASEGGVTGALTGGVIGGAIGLLAGIGSLAIPGLGALVAAGPIVAALTGSAVGGATGLLIGALVGYGIPEYEAKAYEEGIKNGKVLISVLAQDAQIDRAKEIMSEARGESISTSSEVKASRG